MGHRIDFINAILKNKKNKGEQKVYYSLRKYEKMGSFDIFIDISEHVTLIQLMDYLGNVSRAITFVGYCIFDSNYEKALLLYREFLDMICAPSVGEKQVAMFEKIILL